MNQCINSVEKYSSSDRNQTYCHFSAPGPIDQLNFSYVTLTSLKLDWQVPKFLNGILRSYDLTYDNRLSFSSLINISSGRVKTIKQLLSPNTTSLHIDKLDPYQSYEFSLCACTIRCGPCIHKSY